MHGPEAMPAIGINAPIFSMKTTMVHASDRDADSGMPYGIGCGAGWHGLAGWQHGPPPAAGMGREQHPAGRKKSAGSMNFGRCEIIWFNFLGFIYL